MVLLEKQLDKPRSKQNAFTKARVREVEDYLRSGKKLVKGTTLSFIVSPPDVSPNMRLMDRLRS